MGDEVRLQRCGQLMGVYTDPEVYGPVFENLYERFGVYNVMDAYDYTSEPSILSDSRVRKSMYAKLMWEEKDFVTHLFGFEYSDMIYNSSNYDLENDFPAVFYFCGYIGFTLYMLFLALFVGMIFKAFFQDVSAAWREQQGKGRLSASAEPVFLWGRGQAVPHHGDGGGGHDLPAGRHCRPDLWQCAAPSQRHRVFCHCGSLSV